jgi:hypothetical protein
MQRRDYKQARAELEREAYRDGFLAGYEAGVNAATEYHSCDLFTYADHYDASGPVSIFHEEEDQADHWKTASQDLAYEIGYHDAFDRGYHDLSKALEETLNAIGSEQ